AVWLPRRRLDVTIVVSGLRMAGVAPFAATGLQAQPQRTVPGADDRLAEIVQKYLWPVSEADIRAAEAAMSADGSLTNMTRERFHDLEEAMRRGRAVFPAAPARVDGRFPIVELLVEQPAGPAVPVLVQLPGRYDPPTDWPV